MENKHKQFKCKDEVIFQNTVHFGEEKPTWNYGIVNYETDGYVYLVGGLYINKNTFKILPYEGNEELVGTTYSLDSFDEEVELEKEERIICSDDVKLLMAGVGFLTTFAYVDADSFFTGKSMFANADYNYAIRFSDFNPNDIEETSRLILCVKNGKIVKYNEH